MLRLDHLTVLAPSLAEGVAHVRACLGLDVPFGRKHPYMGTHNHLLRLGPGEYLEIVAVDPEAPPVSRARWFGLDDGKAIRAAWDAGFRLRGWVARTDDIDGVLSAHGEVLGPKVEFAAGDRRFFFGLHADGALPLGGLAPSVIDRDGHPPPVAAMADLGAELEALTVEHPDPDAVVALYARLGIENPPAVRKGERLRYRARIRTPGGVRELY